MRQRWLARLLGLRGCIDVKFVDADVLNGELVITFSDGKIAILKEGDVYKFAHDSSVLLPEITEEELPLP